MTDGTQFQLKAEPLEFVLEFWDIPIEGIAASGEQAYYFCARFDDECDAYSKIYEVTPISESTRRLAREAAHTWRHVRGAKDNAAARAAWETRA